MSKSLSPFTREQLLPQEETLEVYNKKGALFIGLPKETHFQEKGFASRQTPCRHWLPMVTAL